MLTNRNRLRAAFIPVRFLFCLSSQKKWLIGAYMGIKSDGLRSTEMEHVQKRRGHPSTQRCRAVNFDAFRTLEGSTVTGSSGIKRLINLMHLNVDTSWYVRYRRATNPDLGATFPQGDHSQWGATRVERIEGCLRRAWTCSISVDRRP